MKFKFAFDKLLAHKKTLEDIARREWAEAQRAVDQATNELNEMYGQVDSARTRAGQLETVGGNLAPALVQIGDFLSGQKIRIERQREKLRELTMVAEQKQDVLVEAAKERKTLEKLREKRYEEYRVKAEQNELKQVDELVVTRFGRKVGG